MADQVRRLAEHLLQNGLADLSERERRVVRRIAQRLHVSRNVNREFEGALTFGDRLADRIAAFGGSWTFILSFFGAMLGWALLNSVLLVRWAEPFDPYPYIFLNLMLSMLAALQAPVIMMSQNRQAAKDRIQAANDYEVNLKAELEIMGLHEKLDALRAEQLRALLEAQSRQIELLERLVRERGAPG